MSNDEQTIRAAAATIAPPDEAAIAAAAARLNSLTKPPGSLGRLEELALQLAGATGSARPVLDRKAVVVMAADHGVCAEGVSAYPPEVTAQMVLNFLRGGAAVNVLAAQAGADVHCVDIGVNAELSHPGLLARKVRPGTANMTVGPAMSRSEAAAAVRTGIVLAGELAGQGYRVLATGEMGIGNTTASAALMCVLAGYTPEQSVGLGTGIDETRRGHKIETVARAIACNAPKASDALDALAKVGGLEIAGLAGLMLGAAGQRLPVVVDGFISTAAALVALRLAPGLRPYLIASHQSGEQGHRLLLESLGLRPPLQLDMRLGEGTGAVLCLHLLEAAVRVLDEMATFAEAGVSDKDELKER
ncbi:nicotinate-nucleotide--dimethylbenzimidazole phosphoribosyltransferase [Paenibacillus sp. IB182496]|uniref:Nicotinate-nucleotide--dimethylbenzimidazole phosphoribosyltransferase n=1 Tax=Paenibacillus sabuli TaxID=2772509 RepID=A0A927BWT1_9BACL|nr:nicotinate-nucleotide--dimethylbenzimidazole phosphoribosyltransferase [Paenibacillus sabuli]MBD2846788.1 nicotinate-nucleotide--dimethylbenzimidazole phosphoribosyltransferase [Paenibacillus sabuli]